jgi:2Fe-2S ferredoxin
MRSGGAVKVTFVQVDGVEKTLESGATQQSLMELGRDNAVAGIHGDCGGGCSCATCHVYIDPQWQDVVGPPDEVELATLDMASDVQQSNSRLSCQIAVRPELDGLRVTVAPMTKS